MRLCEKCGATHGDSIDKCNCGGNTHEVERDAYNAVVYRIAAKVAEIADDRIDDLRREAACNAENDHQAKEETIGMNRGKLIEKIICDDFLEELY